MLRMPIFTWTMLVTSMLILFASRRSRRRWRCCSSTGTSAAHSSTRRAGGDPILCQHLFWFFGHPEVYIVVLPSFGIVTEIIPVFSRKPLFGYARSCWRSSRSRRCRWRCGRTTCSRPGACTLPFFSALSFLIAVPTGIKFFNWIATMWGGQLTLRDADAVGVGFIVRVHASAASPA